MKAIGENYTCIKIEALELRLSIGLLPQEREAPQRIFVDIDVFTGPEYLHNLSEESILDYASICSAVRALEKRPHVLLVEALVQDIVNIAFSYKHAEAVRVKVMKPDILSKVAGVGVEVFIKRPA